MGIYSRLFLDCSEVLSVKPLLLSELDLFTMLPVQSCTPVPDVSTRPYEVGTEAPG